ncbi:hypothetical protein Ait01nite_061400 [Actinoplanes italicus]|uniref:Uncharacterized protein n=1 Tax=Actinoplanes italicus TaxID=113567 RepID=A0A2T0K7F6_9ACTN|nr:hypothetical protein [Actinoplanes italicus]PRX18754.1 hypothetical protein CLV67_112229 [Actinoplanes italicus]GIE33095.1 hypothetical protein Ait01nite_061400 [Actinoplanes italicus]
MSFENLAPDEGNLETFSLATRRVIRFGAVYLVVVALVTALLLSVADRLASGAVDPTVSGTEAWLTLSLLIVNLVLFVCIVGLVVSTIVWIVSAHRVRPTGPGAAGYAGLFLAVVLIALPNLLVLPALPEAAMSLAGFGALLAGVLMTRAQVRRETGRPDLGGRPRTILQSDDWDASKWDPEVHRDIERRGRPTD